MKIPKPTRWQYLLAGNAVGGTIWAIATGTALIIATNAYLKACDPFATFDLKVFAFVSFPLFAAAWMGMMLFTSLHLGGLLRAIFPHLTAEFREGDYVLVLSTKHRGKILRVYSTWQHNTFRVDLGPEAEARYKDILSPWEVLRVEPDDAPASNDVALPPAPG